MTIDKLENPGAIEDMLQAYVDEPNYKEMYVNLVSVGDTQGRTFIILVGRANSAVTMNTLVGKFLDL